MVILNFLASTYFEGYDKYVSGFGNLRENWTYLLIALVAGAVYMLHIKRPRGLPPGPCGLPLVGYAPFLGACPHEVFVELGKRFGNVFSLYISSSLTVVLNDYETIKAAFIDEGDMFADRYPGFAHRELISVKDDPRPRGLTMTNGEQWRTMRRFALTTLRKMGMGKSVLQEQILEELGYLTETFVKKYPQPTEPTGLMVSCIANILFGVTFSKRFEHGDKLFQVVIDYLTVGIPTLSNTGALQHFPWLRHVPGKYQAAWNTFLERTNNLKNLFRAEIYKHERSPSAPGRGTFRSNFLTRDYVDAFFMQRDAELKQGNAKTIFDEEELVISLINLYGAGTETTASTITWAFYYMVLYPEIQKKVQIEIDKHVARDRPVSMDDRCKLAYVEAVCFEIQRLGNLLPLSIARSTSADVTFQGYRIPKGTYVVPNLWNVHRDPRYWQNPDNFQPERFLDKDGLLVKPPYFMPFSVGKRICLGESLAKMELFLFMTTILQKFNLDLAPGYTLLKPHESVMVGGLTTRPPTYEVIFAPRGN